MAKEQELTEDQQKMKEMEQAAAEGGVLHDRAEVLKKQKAEKEAEEAAADKAAKEKKETPAEEDPEAKPKAEPKEPKEPKAEADPSLEDLNNSLETARGTIGNLSKDLIEALRAKEEAEAKLKEKPGEKAERAVEKADRDVTKAAEKLDVSEEQMDRILSGDAGALVSVIEGAISRAVEVAVQETEARRQEAKIDEHQEREAEGELRTKFYKRHKDLDVDGHRDYVALVAMEVFSKPEYAGRENSKEAMDAVAQLARERMGLPSPVVDENGEVVVGSRGGGVKDAAINVGKAQAGQRQTREREPKDKYEGLNEDQRKLAELEDHVDEHRHELRSSGMRIDR